MPYARYEISKLFANIYTSRFYLAIILLFNPAAVQDGRAIFKLINIHLIVVESVFLILVLLFGKVFYSYVSI